MNLNRHALWTAVLTAVALVGCSSLPEPTETLSDKKAVAASVGAQNHSVSTPQQLRMAPFQSTAPSNFIDIRATGATRLSFSERDDAFTAVDLPFRFPFFGKTYGRIIVSTNGAIFFDETTRPANFDNYAFQEYENTLLDDAYYGEGSYRAPLPTQALFPYWDDLYLGGSGGGPGGVYVRHVGSGSAAQTIIAWYASHIDDEDAPVRAAFEVILSANGDIRFIYNDINFPTNPRGTSATIGIKSGSRYSLWSFQSEIRRDLQLTMYGVNTRF